MVEKEFTVELTETEVLISEIATLGFLINSRTEYCVFIRYSGHVDSIDIDIAESKEEYKEKIASRTLYKVKENTDKLKGLRDSLLKILQDEKIPFDELEYRITEVIDYLL